MAKEEIPQNDLLSECERELAKVDEEALTLAGNLTEGQLRWPPPDAGWSIAQVFQHLATANTSYLEGIRAAIGREKAAGVPPRHPGWRPSFFGGMLIRSLEPSSRRSLPSPRIWRPAAEQPTGALEAFLTSQSAIASLVRDARGTDLTRARLTSPASRFIRVNLGDAFKVLVVHDQRHLRQIRRVLARPGFPRREDAPAQ